MRGSSERPETFGAGPQDITCKYGYGRLVGKAEDLACDRRDGQRLDLRELKHQAAGLRQRAAKARSGAR